MCAEEAGITPTNYHLFYDLAHEDICEVIGMITRHEVKINLMKTTYDAIRSSNFNCSAPKKYAKSQLSKMSKECI